MSDFKEILSDTKETTTSAVLSLVLEKSKSLYEKAYKI